MNTRAKIEFGDFQTPAILAESICARLVAHRIKAQTILEPTCGSGAFLLAAAKAFPRARLLGQDVNENYVRQAREGLAAAGISSRAIVKSQDFFTHDWPAEFSAIQGDLLILGNLPWVTNAAVSGVLGTNVPVKENFLGLRGFDARTGKSNFDISEWMLIQLVKALRGRTATIALLCKTSTARKLLRYAWQNDGQIGSAALYHIDAKQHFNVAVDACLLFAKTGQTGPTEAAIYRELSATTPIKTMGLAGADLVADITAYRKLRHLEGLCPYQWRSGVKHDCAAIMEFFPNEKGQWENKLGEQMNLEPDYLFPLLKCTDLAHGRSTPQRFVLVPQKRMGEETSQIAAAAPRTWTYLNSHLPLFAARKSSIYNGKSPFALFGIGPYAFAPWKVAVSGLHKTIRFLAVGPHDGQPVFFDDTCYFLPFDDEREAQVVAAILNSAPCQEFLEALIFPDSKRPITVDVLQRLNLHALAIEAGLAKELTEARQDKDASPSEFKTPQFEFVME